MAKKRGLEVGDKSPRLHAANCDRRDDQPLRLPGAVGGRFVLLPKDNTPVCTTEACSFRDSHEAFRDAGAEVIGISSDSPESHRRFSERLRLPFLLLSDSDGSVRESYGVPRTLGFLPGR